MGEILNRVRRFYEALDVAIYDRDLEDAGEELLFFYDADVAIATIIGLTSWDRDLPPPDVSGLVYVVRALLNTGYLTRIRFLRPHLVEFDRFIHGLPKTTMGAGFHRAAMKHLIDRWQLPASDHELQRQLGGVEGFVDFIRKEGYQVFVKLELCLGSYWEQRLRRLYKANRFDFLSGAADLPIPGDEDARWFAEQMARWRGESASLNNQVDGHALAELARKAKKGLNVRFYTETDAVRKLLAETELLGDRLADTRRKTVKRSEEYFLIRSSFPSLGFLRESSRKAPRPHATSYKPISLTALRELRDSLEEVLRTVSVPGKSDGNPGTHTAEEGTSASSERDPEDLGVEEALRAIAVGDEMNLAELIDKFYKLGFLESIFLAWDPPAEMEMWLPSLYAAKSEETLVAGARQTLGNSLEALFLNLDNEIGQLRDWRDDFLEILRAATDRAKAFGGKRPDPWLDLGLGRWGLELVLSPVVREKLETNIGGLLDDLTRESNCSDLALQLAYLTDETQEFARQLFLLWFLRLDEMICKRFERATPTFRNHLPPWLQLLHQVALVKTAAQRHRGDRPLAVELERVVQKARANVALTEQGGGWSPGFAEMGLAHVCYWAWRATGQSVEEPALEWARQSYQAGERAEKLLERGSLGWSFAVNHCAYMGIRAEIYPETTERFMETLLQDIPRIHDHYRFADTEVWETTVKIRNDVRAIGFKRLNEDRTFARERRELCIDVVRSLARLSAYPHWDDTEVTRHLKTLEHYHSRLRCGRLLDTHAASATTAIAGKK